MSCGRISLIRSLYGPFKCLIILQWIRVNELYKLMESFFQIRFRIIGQKPKNIKTNSEAWISIKVQCVIYQWIRHDKFYKQMEYFFSNFEFVFELLAENRKIFKWISRRGYWSKWNVLAICKWIRLNELYKLMESFLHISKSFFQLTTVFWNNSGVVFMHARWGSICADQQAF